MTAHVLVAGGAGFVGSHLVDSLLDAGDNVIVIDSLITGRAENLAHHRESPKLTIEVASVTEPLSSQILQTPFDRIYHLASPASPIRYAEHPIDTLLVNSAGTHRLLELARKSHARFLFASTSEVYGDPAVHPQVETYWGNVNPIGPRACYDESKRFGESLVVNYASSFGLDVRIPRIFNTYGPRSDPQDGRMIPNFCVQALLGHPVTVYGDGTQTRSVCYVNDLVGGLRTLMENDHAAGEVVNLGNPTEFSVTQIAEAVMREAHSASGIEIRPLPQDDPRRRCPDIGKAERLLGWRPGVSLHEGLRHTITYFRDRLGLDSAELQASTRDKSLEGM